MRHESGTGLTVRPRFFEDFTKGAVVEFGGITVTEPEIIAFARQFDPQPMHTDPVAAANGPTGGLIASGWHTVGLRMRMYADQYLPANGLPAPHEAPFLPIAAMVEDRSTCAAS